MAQIKKIGVFTSGSDSPGMNAAIRAVVRTAVLYDLEVVGIRRGYEGMINGEFVDMDRKSVSNIIQRGGTILKAGRSEEFKTPAGRKKAYDQLKSRNIDGLIALGGNGTFIGAKDLGREFDMPIIGVPCTIDNDLLGTDFTVGYDTAINTAIEAIDKIRDTAESHDRLFIVEVMGADSGLIALRVGIAIGAEAMMIPGTRSDMPALFSRLEMGRKDKSSKIVVVAEGEEPGEAFEIGRIIKEKYPNYDTRISVLGHIQRGGKPTCMDRVLASRLGVAAVEVLRNGHRNEMAGLIHNSIVYTSFERSVKHNIDLNTDLLKVVEMLSL